MNVNQVPKEALNLFLVVQKSAAYGLGIQGHRSRMCSLGSLQSGRATRVLPIIACASVAAAAWGGRDRAAMEKIKEAHRRVIVANHPDAGGSHYLASKINEGKEVLTRRTGERVSIPRSCYECGMLDGLNENSVG
ncbi:unnamed protein product [Ilex paraguariensis]|uniref:J domain-containing protein n=1 Tax=Ilex paraguariensis TaxID=185542 RepID=A0ABC8TB71_9AQUA